MKVLYTPDAMRRIADEIEIPAKIIREIADALENEGIHGVTLQINAIGSKWVRPLTKWADRDFRSEVARLVSLQSHKSISSLPPALTEFLRDQENAATDSAADAFLAAQKTPAKKPVPRKKGKK